MVVLAVGLGFAACGGGGGQGASAPPTSTSAPAPEATGYAFADYDFIPTARSACVKPVKLGSRSKVELVIEERGVVNLFVPNCVFDAKRDEISVTVFNDTRSLHNFIVEGDDFELVLQPGQRKSVAVALVDQPLINFQCTIHRGMHGSFYR
jgi:hypothetical protein